MFLIKFVYKIYCIQFKVRSLTFLIDCVVMQLGLYTFFVKFL